ncbi:triphosphoribosyl-dephospho-CoA synthase [Prevotella sp.]|uniref:triphosphoribosyl-dephospho-CoA synthase n=1 Tax=Prevotella sp. TaxID=59823 RepID=UPI002E769A21|nr:triphosphoribosyl-dephospho-CoA synthase [Prevotella sp.]MEE0669567.1 triphosphoribosyl-dephospho-CoA synthase [Prevotella sp.]
MNILELHPTIPRQRRQIEMFLQTNGLRYDDVDYYATIVDESSDEMIAGGGLKGSVIKCVAVADGHKGEAVANVIVSHLIAKANAEGCQCVKLYTKPDNRQLFESLSFRLIAESPNAILMETGVGGIEKYSEELRVKSEELRVKSEELGVKSEELKNDESVVLNARKPIGVIVMNANPFTLGHRFLVEQSSELVERLYVVVVREDCSMFSYNERKAMVSQGVRDIGNVVVVDGSDYAVSAATFPTYFLKQLSDATDTQIILDLDLYRRRIAPALGATIRFFGSEPTDPLTRRYNELMHQQLGEEHVHEIQRKQQEGSAISASRVRKAMMEGCLWDAIQLVPPTTIPYIIGHLASMALQAELDTTPKPGLVDRNDNGAHRDMDHALMQRSIQALHPYFVRLAQLGFTDKQPCHDEIVNIGIEAEREMFKATGGVNTHKGALFSIGLAAVALAGEAFSRITQAERCGTMAYNDVNSKQIQSLSNSIASLARLFPDTNGTHGSKAKANNILKGALDNAREGYTQLFKAWLPFYIDRIAEGDNYALHKTLLRIMCDLDDTNIVYRTSMETMQEVKTEARQMLDASRNIVNFEAALQAMNTDYIHRNISPGGSADMLSLVVFLSCIVRKQ